MKKFIKNKQFFYIFMLIFLAGFLVLPKTCLADDFEDIDLKDIDKYLELPQKDAQQLIGSLRQVFTTEKINLWGSGYSTDEEIAVTEILLKVIKGEFINYLFRDAPIEITLGIIKGTIDIVRVYIDPSVGFEKLENESVQRAIDYGMKVLLGEDIRVTPGAIKFKYVSNYGSEKEVIFQYIIIYKQLDSKSGETEIRFYSPISIEAPKFLAEGALNLQSDLPPFIVDIEGVVEKTQFDTFQWTEGPSININFPLEVPDLGIKPLNFWERQVLKPIETTIKKVEIIITKVTGKSPKIVDTWEKIKSFISKFKLLSSAGLAETPANSLNVVSQGGLENISNIISQQPEKFSPEELSEIGSRIVEVENKIEVSEEKKLTLEEMQEILDDISEKLDMISQEVTVLAMASQSVLKENQEKIKDGEILKEEESEEEIILTSEERSQTEQNLCQKIDGVPPTRNKVIFNEIAWMGGSNSSNDEWIELKNISGSPINLNGWQILDRENQIKVIFSVSKNPAIAGFFDKEFLLLERTDDNSVPNMVADLIYSGVLGNINEALYLFDNNCQLQDGIVASPDWPAGDKESKRTMERKYDLGWQISLNSGGTPKSENSFGYIIVQSISGGGGGGGSVSSPQETPFPSSTSSPPQILITEIQIASVSSNNDEFIELYNPNDQEVDISSWSIQKSHSTSTVVYKKNFETGNKIPAKGYFLIVYASSTDQNLLNLADFTHKTFNLAPDNTIYLVANQEKIENASDTDIINMVGFGENVFSERNPALGPQDGESIGREWSSTTQNYIDTNNNQSDFEIQNPTPKTQNQSPQPTENQLPIAQFIYSPVNPIINQEILFNASSSTDSDGTITSYIWDFSDNTISTTTEVTTTHSYSTSSNFLVSLTVIDNNNATNSATTTIAITTPETPTLEVVINEIAWMGTATSASDEWIEFYNTSSSIVDIANWSVFGADTEKCLNFTDASSTTTTIPADGYLIYANRREAVKNETNVSIVDIWDATIGMNNTSPGQLILYDATSCQGNIIDIVNQPTGNWFAGRNENLGTAENPNWLRITMERISSTTTGVTSTNWATNNLITRNGLDADGNKVNGTPKAENSVSKSETEIYPANQPPFGEFDELTLTYLGSPYIFKYYLLVGEGKTLNIEPGVILKFDFGWGAEISGTIIAIGQEDKKIIFTSSDESNYWQGIHFTSSSINSELNWMEIRRISYLIAVWVEDSSIIFKNSVVENYNARGLRLVHSSSTIENVEILGPDKNSIGIWGIQITTGSPTIKNCSIKNNNQGIFIEVLNEGDLPMIEGNNFESNEYPVYADNPNEIFKNNRGANNTFNGLVLFNDIAQNITWYKNEIPYIIGFPQVGGHVGVNVGIVLIIEPGVRIELGNGSIIEVEGEILAQGTNDEPITFTGYQPPWKWIHFTPTSRTSKMENVIINQGGGYNTQGQIYVQGGVIEFFNSTSSDSFTAGIHLENSSSTIQNSYFGNNQIGIRIVGEEPIPTISNNTFSNNSKCDIYWPNATTNCGALVEPGINVECNDRY